MKRNISAFLGGLGLLVLIMDSKTAVLGAEAGLSLCIRLLIPSMLPFLFLSALVTSSLQASFSCKPLQRLLRIPAQGVALFALGLLSGYPSGAQNVTLAMEQKRISPRDAQRMVIFCNNPGPAFIFGFGITILGDGRLCLLVWSIQILSALITGHLIPGGSDSKGELPLQNTKASPPVMGSVLQTMGMICGWVVLFRVLLAYLDRWLFPHFPTETAVFFSGALELANGCANLQKLPSLGQRMSLFSAFLGFGGLCVGLQTASVLEQAGLSRAGCWLGKLLQGCLSFLLSTPAQLLLEREHRWIPSALTISVFGTFLLISIIFLQKGKIMVAFRRKMLYNKKKSGYEVFRYAVSQKD